MLPVTHSNGNPAAHATDMPILCVIGDGQLARMMHTAAIELGQSVRILAGAPNASAAQVAGDVVLGDYTNLDDLRRVTEGTHAVTFDHEHVPNQHLETLIAEGINVQPRPAALVNAQDKLVMRQRLAELGAPVPAFAAIDSVEDATAFWNTVDGAVCLKARRGGYDGKGVWFPDTLEELTELVSELLAAGTPLMGEHKVTLVRELSAMVARTPSGEVKGWPVVESIQKDGICWFAIAPATELSPELKEQAENVAITIATELGVTGNLAVELFETPDGIFVNELAMRPHNTGHWTQDGCVTDQFEQHIRAVLDLPLGSTAPLQNYTVMANVLGAAEEPETPMPQRMIDVWKRYPEAKIHMYGKDHRLGRKIGHVNMAGTDVEELKTAAENAAYYLVHAEWKEQ
ncbi:5-(carboxyamino)imidazole ribonucleotide synthase [Corynebacterium diphtheriae bv. mitis]|uniref:5-(carboxyamino)imidazole ribonucleotide synthase n=1 Tax=Corynebacterium diphtheriae TaxID=1717 RepID=UPI0018CAC092|nr:5-(carboxyamino)imidazole ribonucleotide synthase [Corynebacterium diphtheriae]MBG9359643.1 5-(carboxyamino)imidazole ribonucleotide synthase [Corynebacterium diphtheriae bv. mitis]MBG9361846.1 5-(carboxyamino)imidazole ribonucleotide synthase [Corynebacterium diphtheriae bv. mitis]MBG9364003.1 5-(carboxyamino)imidazole ribonucleotide synthase [Corynebacterium diphtheriae bv. mitis]MBG9365528.1 5-(carboxyamino)imidazole ribonucleotide synthase [Corynebacterium diphtheriae bv. mitis]UWE84595